MLVWRSLSEHRKKADSLPRVVRFRCQQPSHHKYPSCNPHTSKPLSHVALWPFKSKPALCQHCLPQPTKSSLLQHVKAGRKNAEWAKPYCSKETSSFSWWGILLQMYCTITAKICNASLQKHLTYHLLLWNILITICMQYIKGTSVLQMSWSNYPHN